MDERQRGRRRGQTEGKGRSEERRTIEKPKSRRSKNERLLKMEDAEGRGNE